MLPANTGWFDWILLDVMQGNKEESSCFSLLPVAFHVFLHYDQQIKVQIGLKFVDYEFREMESNQGKYIFISAHTFLLPCYISRL
ncbi:MAG: hypothetical protein D3913_06015 [Candidatus Electrothrix sp. LOE1_4_5]|nr:hypothetical protein [Candidatus Electrothrix gigas]